MCEVSIMPLTRFQAENFTVFENITIPFSKGLNILVGENGMVKIHISFPYKTAMLFRPDQSSIGRLVNRNKMSLRQILIPNISLY